MFGTYWGQLKTIRENQEITRLRTIILHSDMVYSITGESWFYKYKRSHLKNTEQDILH